nr:unnamed protein product [Spirometra erinaceieuropaei]
MLLTPDIYSSFPALSPDNDAGQIDCNRRRSDQRPDLESLRSESHVPTIICQHTDSEVQGILDRLFQASGSSEFKLPSSPSFYARDPTSTTRSVATRLTTSN